MRIYCLNVYVGDDHVADVVNLKNDWPWLQGELRPTKLFETHSMFFQKLSDKEDSDTLNLSTRRLFAVGFYLKDLSSGERLKSTPDAFLPGEVVRFLLDGTQCRLRIL